MSFFKSNRTKIGYAIQIMFKLTQNKRDKELLELVAKFMNCGAVYSHGENAFDFTVSNFADNQNIIILTKNPYFHEQSKYINICYYYIQDLAKKKTYYRVYPDCKNTY